jgi:tetratricopeptide (TPR) repeat protein
VVVSLFIAVGLAFASVQSSAPAGAVVQVQSKDGTNSEIQQSKDPLGDQLEQGFNLIHAGKPADAIALFDKIIAAEEDQNRNEKRLIFSARSMAEAILYAGMGAAQKKSAVVLDGTWSGAYFGKGFALIDLGRADEAKGWFDKAIALAPMNAQFLAERAEWFKSRKDWAKAYADFESASTAAEFSPDNAKSFEQRRAWRGMAFARTEQGKLDEARKLLQKCLKLDAGDDKCQHELQYVNGLKSN